MKLEVCLARITKADLVKRKKSLDGFLKKLDPDGRASEKMTTLMLLMCWVIWG